MDAFILTKVSALSLSASSAVRTLMEARAPLGFSAWDTEPSLHAAAARGQWLVAEALERIERAEARAREAAETAEWARFSSAVSRILLGTGG